jgi:hypothetical protein
MRIYSLLVISLVLLASCSTKYQLGLNLDTGEIYTHEINSKVSVEQTVSGNPVKVDMRINGKMEFKVLGMEENIYELEVQYKYLSLAMQTPYGFMEFNTDPSNKDTLFSPFFRMLVNRPFNVKMDKQGKVHSIQGLDLVFDDMFKSFPDLNETEKAQIKSQLMEAYGEESFKGNFEMATYIYSDKKVAKGESWTLTTELEGGMKATITSNYTLESSDSNVFHIVGDADMKTDPDEVVEQPNGLGMKQDLNGKMTCDITVDRKTGWVIEAKIIQDFKGNTIVESGPSVPGGMTIPLKMSTNMTITN